MNYHLSPLSENSKLGIGVSASISDKKTCPKSCPLLKGCYAKSGPIRIHWEKVSNNKRGGKWDDFVGQVNALPNGFKLRLFQAGDMPSKRAGSENIDRESIKKLSRVVKRKKLKAWGYTHKKLNEKNVEILKECLKDGLVINASADSFNEADDFFQKGIPTVVTVPSNFSRGETKNRVKIVVCPNQINKKITCSHCMKCQKTRDYIIGFRSTGKSRKKMDERINKENCD